MEGCGEMTDRERLLKILNVPIFSHENVDPLEAVADYLLDNGVTFSDAVAHQRSRADAAETFICKLCAECEWDDKNGITVMTKKCCNWFPECGKFKLRSGWIPVTERLPEEDLPKDSTSKQIKVLVAYKRGNCSWVIRTQLRKKGQWYRRPDEWDWSVSDPITHWMPLPEPPKEE